MKSIRTRLTTGNVVILIKQNPLEKEPQLFLISSLIYNACLCDFKYGHTYKSSQFSVLGPSSVQLPQYVMRYSNLDDEKTSPSHCLIRGLFVILANVKGAWTTATLKYQP